MIRKKMILPLCMFLLCAAGMALAEETHILLGESITVNGSALSSDPGSPVYLTEQVETHEDVPDALRDLANRVVVITGAGSYRISGKAEDTQILVRAGKEDDVRLILDGADITCRTAPAIAVETARDPRVPGEYGVTIELAAGSENLITGSHTKALDDDGNALEYDGAIGSQVSLGFEGSGSLTVDADNEGVEVAFGHLTINGGVIHIRACDDPLNVAEDGVGTLTINDGYVYSAVKPLEGSEGDGVDSNGYIVFNGGTIINLAHPSSGDSGIDSDMGSSINGGLVVGAGNMYNPIDENSQQLFMMLEFAGQTDQLVVVTDENDVPVFAYDFPHSYTYIAFSSPALSEGIYHVYLGGDIEGEAQDGLYTSISSYTPGTRMQHGGGTAQAGGPMGGMTPPERGSSPFGATEDWMAYQQALDSLDLNELLRDVDLNVLLRQLDLNDLLTGYPISDLLTPEQLSEYFGGIDPDSILRIENGMPGFGRGGMDRGGFGDRTRRGPRSLESSADKATGDFVLSRESTGFTNIMALQTP